MLVVLALLLPLAACGNRTQHGPPHPAGLLGNAGEPYALDAEEVAGGEFVPGSSVLERPGGDWLFLPAGAAEPVVVPADDPAANAEVAGSREWLTNGQLPGSTTEQRAVAERALLDLRLLTQPNGSVAAAWHGIWAYSWPRDSAFVAAAFARTGHLEEAYRILEFNASTQLTDCAGRAGCEEGTWDARTRLDGSGPPDDRAWQLDANGWLPWAVWQYHRAAPPDEQERALAELYPMVALAADAAARSLDAQGLPPARPDYWESSYRQPNLGTAAPLLAGLRAAADLAGNADRVADADRWAAAADQLADAIDASFGANGYQRTVRSGSGRDSAITFLAPPFAPAELAPWGAIDATWDSLVEPTGGVKPGEAWSGSETWTPETMFFALAWAGGGQRERATDLVAWLADHRTEVGAFPEKVTPAGEPTAVATLAWTASLGLLTLSALDEPIPVPPA